MVALKLNKATLDQVKTKTTAIKKYTVLAVDDEEANLSALVRALDKEYNVLTATDGREALERIKKRILRHPHYFDFTWHKAYTDLVDSYF